MFLDSNDKSSHYLLMWFIIFLDYEHSFDYYIHDDESYEQNI